jgi:hypothetical protein
MRMKFIKIKRILFSNNTEKSNFATVLCNKNLDLFATGKVIINFDETRLFL